MIPASIKVSVAVNGVATVSDAGVEYGNNAPYVEVAIPAGAADMAVSLAFTLATLQGLVILADQPCTLKANSPTAPTDTINLKANRAYPWRKSDSYWACPITADVTAGYVTAATATKLRIWVLTS